MRKAVAHTIHHFLAAILLICIASSSYGQFNWQSNTFFTDTINVSKNTKVNNLINGALGTLKRGPVDTVANNLLFKGRSEVPYKPFEGKIIRHIYFKQLDFESNLTDTSIRIISIAAKVADKVHTNTQESVLRNNLFIKEHTPLNAYKTADNERYLRSLDFIQDARIIITKISPGDDSIDLLVITKDLFNISADGSSNGFDHIYGSLIDANFMGTAQRLEASTLYDPTRQPNMGWGATYKKNNLGNSFVSMSAGISSVNKNTTTHQEENTSYINFTRPLVSPYTRMAGGLLLSINDAYNRYNIPAALFYRYNYILTDAWLAYNLGVNHLMEHHTTPRDRSFISLRYFNYNFLQSPLQLADQFDPIYNNRKAILGQITFFRQEYFKTQYIYGFGTTEDLPYGYNVSFTGGWHEQLNLQRPYLGVNLIRNLTTESGDFIQLYFKTGTFLNSGMVQDATLLLGFNTFCRLMYFKNIKVRPIINLSYSALDKPLSYAPLRLNNIYGIGGWLSDSIIGYKRLSLQLESEFYLKDKILGFQFAPFTHIDLSTLVPADNNLYHANLYSGWGGGIRTRNENLVFETIEFRFYYYPITPTNMQHFKIVLNSNIRFRYNSNLISPPSLIELNSE